MAVFLISATTAKAFVCVFTFIQTVAGLQGRTRELVSSIVLFRHGARAPVANYSDEIMRTIFRNGLGQLTDKGLEGNRKIGRFLRQRYVEGKDFLRVPLLPKQVYFRSTGVGRCLMTGLGVGSVMFAGSKPAMSAVPIYTQETRSKDLLLRSPKECKYENRRLFKKCGKEPGHYKTWPEYEAFVFECMGLNALTTLFKEPGSFAKAEPMYNEDKNGLKEGDTEFARIKDELYDLYQKVYAYNIGVGEPKMLQIKQGLLMDFIIKELTKQKEKHKEHGVVEERKFIAISTQDWLIQALLHSLGAGTEALGDTIPEYNALLMFELWKNEMNYDIEVLYKKDVNSEAKIITQSVRKCNGRSPCSFDEFAKCCDDYRIEDSHTLLEKCDEEYEG
ncbi:unnamed protein product [Cylicocyclus nassatus]|uniref:acid phosphatase n=1 Tax=Cylicocyclus nassatus TaxID=53992 RepID=A0AA36H4W2_CYLNA|nr:unnamed protein product [Cylicocyclus nassatus]